MYSKYADGGRNGEGPGRIEYKDLPIVHFQGIRTEERPWLLTEMHDLFSRYGIVHNIHLNKDTATNQYNGEGSVTYLRQEYAEVAVANLNSTSDAYGSEIRVWQVFPPGYCRHGRRARPRPRRVDTVSLPSIGQQLEAGVTSPPFEGLGPPVSTSNETQSTGPRPFEGSLVQRQIPPGSGAHNAVITPGLAASVFMDPVTARLISMWDDGTVGASPAAANVADAPSSRVNPPPQGVGATQTPIGWLNDPLLPGASSSNSTAVASGAARAEQETPIITRLGDGNPGVMGWTIWNPALFRPTNDQDDEGGHQLWLRDRPR